MKNAFLFLILNILSIFLGYASFKLAQDNLEGWGWFLFGAIITACGATTVGYEKKDSDSDTELP